MRRRASPSARRTAPVIWADNAIRYGAPIATRERGELVRRGPGRGDIPGGEQDVGCGGEDPRPSPRRLRFLHHAPDRRHGRLDLALGQPEQGEPRLRRPPMPVGFLVGRLRLGKLAAQPVQLTELVEGGADSRLAGRLDQTLAGPAGFLHRLGHAPRSCRISARRSRHCPR